jgi:hypothetical protein
MGGRRWPQEADMRKTDLPKPDGKVSENKVAEEAGGNAGALTDDQLNEVRGGEIVVTKRTDSASPGLF